MQRVLHFIDGEARPSRSARSLELFDPATADTLGKVEAGNAEDVDDAVAAAARALPAWSGLPHSQRARLLNRLADALEQKSDEFAELETLNTGKPLWLSRDIEIPRAISNLRFFAAAATQFSSESHHGEAGLNYTLRQPLGVVGCISPWNLPLYLLTWKIAPALAMGNTVVAKPSEITPLSAARLGELCAEVGLPSGVLNIVHGLGDQAGRALVEHPQVRAISFTGSTAVGKRIAQQCAAQLKKVSLELGGKNATIVFADAARDGLIPQLLRSGWQNTGQICLCGSRLLIERSAYAEIRDAMIAAAGDWSVGDPQQAATRLGPVVSRAHFDKVMSALNRARAEGATVLVGGEAEAPQGRCSEGWYITPTLLEGLPADSSLHGEEIFGPVISLQPFDDMEHALALANGTDYGLAASVWTQNLNTAHAMAAQLKTGIVWINTWMMRDLRTPFGGVGDSGMGREGGVEALRFFTEPKNVCLGLP